MKHVISRLVRIRRRYGTRAVIRLVIHRLLNRLAGIQILSVTWMSRDFFRPSSFRSAEIWYRLLTADEVRAFAADPSNKLRAEMAERINTGRNFCFAALVGGRLAAYCWCALESIEPEHTAGAGVALSYPKHLAYLYHGFTHPSFRGKRLRKGILQLAFQHLADHGVRELFALVNFTNFSAIRGSRRLGYVPLGHMVVSRLGRSRVLFFPRRAKQLGIRFGKEVVARQSQAS